MFDGLVRMLTNIRHVLEMKNNLISLGILDGNGHCCTIEDGAIEVTKGALCCNEGEKSQNIIRACGGL